MAKEYIDKAIAVKGLRMAHDLDGADFVANITAADVHENIRGNWIRGGAWSEGCGMGEEYGFYYECSVCKDEVKGDYKNCTLKFCPNCGAQMMGGAEDG